VTATKQDFTVYQGESKTLQLTIVDGAAAAKNLTGISAVTWRLGPLGGGAAALTKSLAAGVTVVGATSGRIDVALATADTAALAAGHYLHLTEVIDVAGDTETVTVGTVTVKERLS